MLCPALSLSPSLVFVLFIPSFLFFDILQPCQVFAPSLAPLSLLLFTAPIPLVSLTPRNPPISILPGNSIKGPAFPFSSLFFFIIFQLFFIITITPYPCSIGHPSPCSLFRFSLLLSPPPPLSPSSSPPFPSIGTS